MKKYMVIEHFKPGCYEPMSQRWATQGRMLPEGLYYLNSWTNRDQDICFQLMETTDPTLFETWIKNWEDLVDFEVYPLD
ncbi:MAG: DUF3303 family protein [Bacteroidota bacterium]